MSGGTQPDEAGTVRTWSESVLAAAPGPSGGQLAAAAARARRAARAPGGDADALVELGADVAGLCLSAFLLWVRDRCRADDVGQVVFLARDGDLPCRMAQAMPADHWQGMDLSYRHGSRRLWSLAAAAVVGVDDWLDEGMADTDSFLLQGRHRIPFGALLSRVGLVRDDLRGQRLLAGLPAEQPLPRSLDDVWRTFLRAPEVRRSVEQRAQEQYALLEQHLQGTGLLRRRTAVVDVGWRGQLAWQISAVLRQLTGSEPLHLHFGGVDVAPSRLDARILRFAVDDSVSPLPFPEVVSCVETVTASGRPRAVSLTREDGQPRLTFAPALPAVDSPARHAMWQAAIAVAAELPSRSSWPDGPRADDLAPAVRAILTAFWTTPTYLQAQAAAQLHAEVDDTGADVRPVAVPYSWGEVLRRRPAARTWRAGSLRLTPEPRRTVVRGLLSAKG